MANNIWKKLYGIINGALRMGIAGPTITGSGNNVAINDNTGSGNATLTVNAETLSTLNVLASDAKQANLTMQTGAATNIPMNLPNTKGNAGDVLMSDGAGNWYWNTTDYEGIKPFVLNFNSAATVNLTNMPANFLVDRVVINVTTAFTGGTGSTVSVGVAGTTSAFTGTADCALSAVGTYEIDCAVLQILAAQMIATFTANGATAGAAAIYVIGSVPS